ncbi:hypothetical protein H4Q26_015550 [Puccinia striiformis f. sp. tritici PST-130]|nr:hypothetical protein H4Q26_015550 [Puccinia striiformis f. sp. tritici PST-130]
MALDVKDVHVIKRDFFPNITTKTKEKKTQRRAARKFFKQFGGPAPSKEPIHPHNPTEAEISNAYTIVNDSKQFGLYSYGHVHIFNMRNSIVSQDEFKQELTQLTDQRIFAIANTFNEGWTLKEVWIMTRIDKWFLHGQA